MIKIFLLFSFIVVKAQDLNTQLNNYLKEKLKEYSSFEYQVLSAPKSYKSIKVLLGNDYRLSGNIFNVPIEIDNGKNVFNSVLQLRVKLYRDVLISTKEIKKGSTLSSKDIVKSSMDVSTLRGHPVYNYVSVDSLRASSLIKPGDAIFEENTEALPVVLKDSKVTAFLVKGNVEVSIEAVAKKDGAVGDIITIQTSDNKRFSAKVIDSVNVNIIE